MRGTEPKRQNKAENELGKAGYELASDASETIRFRRVESVKPLEDHTIEVPQCLRSWAFGQKFSAATIPRRRPPASTSFNDNLSNTQSFLQSFLLLAIMVSFAASCAILSLWSASKVLAQVCTPCEDVHFFLARGNNEPYPGRQGDLVAATCDNVANCGYEDLIYSALYTDLSCQTTYDGTIAGFKQMTAYADRCPNSKLILAGYSQGAQIVTDILGGGGGVSFNGCIQPSTPPLDPTTSPGNRLSAVITFGNTRHTANQPYNYGNGSSHDGLFPRSGDMLTALDAYAAITRDWCLDSMLHRCNHVFVLTFFGTQVDPICANNSNGIVASHLGYYNVYSDEAAAWIKSVASITDNSDFTTSIATYVSGTAQDYATVGTGTPSGVVTLASVTTESISCPSSSTPAFAAVNSTALNRTTTASRSGVSSSHSAPLTTTASSAASSSATAAATITSAPSSTGPVATSAMTSAPSSTFTGGSASSHASNIGLALLLGLAILVVV
ncbi:hypothetical protein AYO20_06351 [Fonsecaea nubica]|uniref:Cutinase n=1 Tax=Fonsecaea nubica TaxID=856822 RepID=A0A178CWS8_9EURO|nr:hypothetical protein AYO20_06351 [Fonsecaea nubica]OAL34298.1 hypothetical protein AYO20_06351 [Fonsecaea nubica]